MKSTSMLESPYLCLRQRVFRLPIRVHQVHQWMELTWSNWLNYLHPSTVLQKKICLINKLTLLRLLNDLQPQQHLRHQQAQMYLKICRAPAKVLKIYLVIIIKNSSNFPLLIYLLQAPKKVVNLIIILKMKTQGLLLLLMLLREELLKITLSIRGDRNLTKSVKSKK